jgi:hypothetical protein
VLGRLEEAEDRQRDAVELATRMGDVPLRGQRLMSLAATVLFRGRIDEAIALRDEAEVILTANPEPQAAPFMPAFDAYAAVGRGDHATAAERFVECVRLARDYSVDVMPESFPNVVRELLAIGDRASAERFRDLDDVPEVADVRAAARQVRGLLERDPNRAVLLLRESVAELRALQMMVVAARAMVDLARAMRRIGHDPGNVLLEARETLRACDARLFLREVEEAEAAALG